MIAQPSPHHQNRKTELYSRRVRYLVILFKSTISGHISISKIHWDNSDGPKFWHANASFWGRLKHYKVTRWFNVPKSNFIVVFCSFYFVSFSFEYASTTRKYAKLFSFQTFLIIFRNRKHWIVVMLLCCFPASRHPDVSCFVCLERWHMCRMKSFP